MAGVKQSIGCIVLGLAVFCAAGCSGLSRFAPPGVVKYEDIASEKEPNPAIQQRISERKEAGDSRFPVLAETPGEKDRPAPRPQDERDTETSELVQARDALEAAIAADRKAAEEEGDMESLIEQSQTLSGRIDSDARAAQRERKDPLPDPSVEN